ncbi:MAG: ABC transporter permease [Thermoplasmata archaeon]
MGDARGRVAGRAAWAAGSYLLPIVLFVLLFALVPVAILFGYGWWNGGGASGFVATIWSNSLNDAAFANSLEQGALSAVLAFALGYPAGVFLARYRWWGRSAARALLLLPFLLPTVVVVVAIQSLFWTGGLLSSAWSPLGWWGSGVPAIIAANLVFNVPIVVLFTALGCESASGALEENAATLGASPARAYRDVWAFPSLAGAAVGALLTFVFSALAFAAPIVLCGPRCYTLEARVYSLYSTALDPTGAALLGLGMFLLLSVPIALYLVLARELRRGDRSGPLPARPVREGGWVAAVLAAETAAVFLAIGVVLGGLVYRSVAPGGGTGLGSAWTALFGSRSSDLLGLSVSQVIANTLGLALLAAGIALVLVLVATVGLRSRTRWEGALTGYLFLPLLISPVLLAFSLAEFWRPLFGGESTVWVLIVIAQAMLALPFALQSVGLSLSRLSRPESDSVRTLGASRWIAFWDADVPRIRNGLVTAALFSFAIGLGEFTATNFLYTTQFTTLSVAVYTLENERFTHAYLAAAALLLLVSLALFVLIAAIGRSRAEPR